MSSAFNIPAGWREVVESLVAHIETNECWHEDTYRGGAIWTICRDCDKKWADDRGGFKPYVRSAVLLAADKLLAASPTPPVDAVPGEPVALNLLREAVETIDTLPGYPKGADLCDRIEAYLAASVASRAGSEPVAKPDGHLHDDGCFTWAPGHRPKERDAANYAGWRAPFYLAPIAPAAAAEPSERSTTPLQYLARAMQILSNAVRSQGGGEFVRERVQRAFVDLQSAHVALANTPKPADRERAAPLVASEDTKRLDYLQRRGATVDLVEFSNGGATWKFRIGGLHRAVNEDIRAAIDAARASAGEAQS